ncbi:MAG: metallophosphoesterase family protein [Aurantibacter sp.]
MSRRHFLRVTSASSLALTLPSTLLAQIGKVEKFVKIGLIADLHQDIMHDGKERLSVFLRAMEKFEPDAIIQLGDFAYPGDKNKDVIDMFNSAHSTSLHVIGNHDTDAGFSKQQCIDYWGMPARYYAQNVNGITFMILDGNDKGSPTHKGGYASYVGEEQWIWLKEQLDTIEGPIVIVSHQPLAGAWAVDNSEEIQEILGAASDKIVLAINGHSHIDSLLRIKNIPYLHLNSASYQWVGSDYKHQSYSKEIHNQFPWVASTCPYRHSLFATMTIDLANLSLKIEGKKSEWVGKSPAELGSDLHPDLVSGEEIAPHIRSRHIEKVRQSHK